MVQLVISRRNDLIHRKIVICKEVVWGKETIILIIIIIKPVKINKFVVKVREVFHLVISRIKLAWRAFVFSSLKSDQSNWVKKQLNNNQRIVILIKTVKTTIGVYSTVHLKQVKKNTCFLQQIKLKEPNYDLYQAQ